MGISVNGPSGIDTQYIIDSLVQIEQTKVTTVQNEKKAYQVKIDAYAKLKTMLNDLKTSAAGLSKLSSFDLFTTKSTDEKVATVTAGTGSVDASYDVRVFQLAGNEKMISANNLINDQNATLADLGLDVGAGTIGIDGVDITVAATDTLQDLRQKINSATDADGNRIGVTASVLKISDSNYRLVLTAKESGSEGVAYSGTLLRELGIIADDAGDKGTTRQTLTSAENVEAAWNSMAVGNLVQVAGTDRNGNAVSVAIRKMTNDTIADFQAKLSEAFKGMADVSIFNNPDDPADPLNGTLTVTDNVGGSSQLAITSMTFDGGTPASITMSAATLGDEGSGVLSLGKDAFFSVENVFMSNSTNKATGFVSGVTFDFHKVSQDDAITLSIERDEAAITKKFQTMLDNYNALVRFSKTNTKVADPNDENARSGDLAGDMTVRNIISQINGMFHQQFDAINTDITSFNQLGLKTNTENGELEIDKDKFQKVLSENLDEVANMFITLGTSDNRNITLGTYSKDTKSGQYTFEETDDQHFRAQRAGDTVWYTSAARIGEIVSFEDGPLKGLSVTAAAGSIGAGNSATFTMSKGLAAVIDDAMENITRNDDGLVALRTKSWQDAMSRADDKIDQLNERVEKYRLRLVNQFSAMEQALNTLKTQSSNMLSALGSVSSDNNN